MLIQLLFNNQIPLFIIIVVALVISLTLHEFGHAVTAKLFGDNTAQQAGRLTLNPLAHIDPAGLLMVLFVGFGFAKPVPTNPRNFKSTWASLFVSAAGPAMNLLIAIVALNLFVLGNQMGWGFVSGPGQETFFYYLITINLVLMVFNLLPIGALDGHYILPYFLPKPLAHKYIYWNHQYGNFLLMGLILLSILGIPIFSYVWKLGTSLIPFIQFV